MKYHEAWWALMSERLVDITRIAVKVGVPTHDIARHVSDRNARYVLAWLDQVWANAPDSPVIHDWEGWGDLCDLCADAEHAYKS